MRILKFIDRLYDKKISSKGLAVFRICFALNLFFEVNRIFRYRQLYFDPMPYITEATFDFTIPLLLWMFVLLLITFGLFTRVATIVNYIFCVWILNALGPTHEYHMDYTYLGVGFMMMFIPLAQSYSLDSLRKKLKFYNLNKQSIIIEKTSVLYYYILIFFGVAVVYFDSMFFKFKCLTWLNGLGMWLPASLPQITIFNDQWLLNQEYLIKALGYLTFLFELVFPFIFFIKKIRPYLLIIGLGLHVGILFEFPIPFFALGVIAIYMALVPVKFWEYFENKIRFKKSKLYFFYDAECPLCIRTKLIISHLDVFKAINFKSVQEHASKTQYLNGYNEDALLRDIHSINLENQVFSGVDTYKEVCKHVPFLYVFYILFYIPGVTFIANKIYSYIARTRGVERCTFENCGIPENKNQNENSKLHYFLNSNKVKLVILKVVIVALVFFQLNSTFFFLLKPKNLKTVSEITGVKEKSISGLWTINNKCRGFSHKYFGITLHGVFVDAHFKGYEKIFSIKYENEFLPILSEKGMPDEYLLGGSWINYSYRVSMPNVSKKPITLKKGLPQYASFWAHKNGVDLNNAEFTIVMKKVKVTFEWEKDLLKNNLATPWKEVGTILWKNNKATVSLEKINSEN